MTVQASDGGEVTVQLHTVCLIYQSQKHAAENQQGITIDDPFIEVIGKVMDGTTIKAMMVVNQGSDLGTFLGILQRFR